MLVIKYCNQTIKIENRFKNHRYYTISESSLNESSEGHLEIYRDKMNIFCQINLYDRFIVNGISYFEPTSFALDESFEIVINKKSIHITKDDYKHENDIKLPFSVPEYATYPEFTAILGILSGYDKAKIWIYNNFIQLWADNYIQSYAYWADFKYANEYIRDDFCPYIYKRYRGNYKTNSDFIKTIQNYINNKIYFFVSIDMFEIDEWWRENEQRWHHVHQVLIYGYNKEKNEFLVADFFQGVYQTKKISFEKIKKAYFSNTSGNDEYEKMFSGDILIMFQNCDYKIDLERIHNLLKDFLQSKDTTFYNYLNICKNEMVVYGMDYVKHLRYYVIECRYNNQRIDIRPFQLLYYMNKIMYERMGYLDEKNYLFIDKDIKIKMQKTLSLMEYIRNLSLQVSMTKNCDLSDKLIKFLASFEVEEKDLLLKIYNLFENKKESEKILSFKKTALYIQAEELLNCNEKALQLYERYKKSYDKLEKYNHYKYNVFPFESELRGEPRNGVKVYDNEINATTYLLDEKGKVLVYRQILNEFSEYKTMTVMVYEYGEKYTIRYSLCKNVFNNKYELNAVDIYSIKDDKYISFARATKYKVNFFGDFKYKGKQIIESHGVEIKDCNKAQKFSYLFIYDSNGDCKQILKEDLNKKSMIYPKYGINELDYNLLKIDIVEETKKIMYRNSFHMKKLIIEFKSPLSEVIVRFNGENSKEEKYFRKFMDGYVKESEYELKTTIILKEAFNEIFNSPEYVKKNKTEDFEFLLLDNGKTVNQVFKNNSMNISLFYEQ